MYVKKNISILLAVVILLLSLPMSVGAVSDSDLTAPSAILVDSENFKNYYKFDSKYFYMPGANYMLNLYFRF